MAQSRGPHAQPDSHAGSSLRQAVYVVRSHDGHAHARYDEITREDPLEIRVHASWLPTDAKEPEAASDRSRVPEERTLSVTLRTPAVDDVSSGPEQPGPFAGARRADCELALGYLFSEGLLTCRADVVSLRSPDPNVVVVTLRPSLPVPWRSVERMGVTSSACGLCGKTSLDALSAYRAPAPVLEPSALPALVPGDIAALSQKLSAAQPIFARTGGLHAAALFDWHGALIAVREDIGRHNAVDKLLGSQILAAADAQAPLRLFQHILWVSGRAGYELVQKARMASLPLFVAVGAPSSLAVQLAKDAGMSLIAFCRPGQFNVYSAPDRIALAPLPRDGA